MRALFREFVEESGFHDKPGPVGRMIKRNIEAFRLIEQSVASPTDLTVSSVLIALDGDTNRRRYRVLKNWLALRMKLNFRGPEAAWIRHTTYINGVIESEEAEWIRKSLKDFLATIYVRREKLIQANSARTTGPKEIASINLAVNYALWFMRFCVESGAGSLPALNQELLERYASERPKVFQGLGAFVRYLNRTSHRLNQMTLPKKTRPASSLKNKIPSAKRSQLIRAFLNADTGADLRNSVIGLLALLYVRRVVQIIRLKLSDVRDSAGLLEINFGQGYWEIAPEVANLVRRWIDEWRAPSRFQVRNDAGYLFPGTQSMSHCSAISFHNWLRKKHGVNGHQLLASSIHGVLDAGLDDPGVLVHHYGISVSTAIRYWQDSGRNVTTFIFDEAIKKLRDEGYFERKD